MIDRIVVVCQSKQDSLKWVELIQHQMKVNRQSTHGGSTLQPTPPPHSGHAHQQHVSATPLYALLTGWIRSALKRKVLNLEKIRAFTAEPAGRRHLLHFLRLTYSKEFGKVAIRVPKSPEEEPKDKLPTREESAYCEFKKNLVLQYREAPYPSQLNPFLNRTSRNLSRQERLGSKARENSELVLVFDNHLSGGDYAFHSDSAASSVRSSVLDHPDRVSTTTITVQSPKFTETDLKNAANWSRLGAPMRLSSEMRSGSLDVPSGSKRLMPPVLPRQARSDCGPTHQSSVESKRDTYVLSKQNSTDTEPGFHGRFSNASSIKWIDRTPSEMSLNIPYCPPVLVDYDEFRTITVSSRRTSTASLTKKRSSKTKKDICIKPLNEDNDKLGLMSKIASTCVRPMPSRRNSTVSTNGEDQTPRHTVSVETTMPSVKLTEMCLPSSSNDRRRESISSQPDGPVEQTCAVGLRSTCSSDSGLADISRRQSSATVTNGGRKSQASLLSQCQPRSEDNFLFDDAFPPRNEDEEQFFPELTWPAQELKPPQISPAVSTDPTSFWPKKSRFGNCSAFNAFDEYELPQAETVPTPPPPKEFSDKDLDENENSIRQEKPAPVYRSTLYAHWWMKAALTPVEEREEPIEEEYEEEEEEDCGDDLDGLPETWV